MDDDCLLHVGWRDSRGELFRRYVLPNLSEADLWDSLGCEPVWLRLPGPVMDRDMLLMRAEEHAEVYGEARAELEHLHVIEEAARALFNGGRAIELRDALDDLDKWRAAPRATD